MNVNTCIVLMNIIKQKLNKVNSLILRNLVTSIEKLQQTFQIAQFRLDERFLHNQTKRNLTVGVEKI